MHTLEINGTTLAGIDATEDDARAGFRPKLRLREERG